MEEGGSLVVKELRVANKGWEFLELSDAEQATAEQTNPNTLTLTLTLTLSLTPTACASSVASAAAASHSRSARARSPSWRQTKAAPIRCCPV